MQALLEGKGALIKPRWRTRAWSSRLMLAENKWKQIVKIFFAISIVTIIYESKFIYYLNPGKSK
jgi:hypothetical protein